MLIPNMPYLNKLFDEKKATYEALGKAVGVAPMSIYRVFNRPKGDTPNPQLRVFLKICEMLEANPSRIFREKKDEVGG